MREKTEQPSNIKFIYAIVVCSVFLWVELRACIDISEPYFSGEKQFQKRSLKRGYSFLNYGYMDSSDHQWNSFTHDMFPMIAFFVTVSICRKIWEYIMGIDALRSRAEEKREATNSLYSKESKRAAFLLSLFYSLFGCGFALYLYQGTNIYYLPVLLVFYLISLLNGSKLNPILTWVFAVGVLFSCDYYRGYRVFNYLLGPDHWIASIFDGARGAIPWQGYFRMTMLRGISYNFDKYLACRNAPVYKSTDEETKRVVSHLPMDFFGFIQCMGYLLYPQLHLAGPIITFNNFCSQLAVPIKCELNTVRGRVKEVVWTAFLFVILTVMLHYNCIHALSVGYQWEQWKEPWKVKLIGFWTLQFMYLKFVCFWRFFRTFALFDNIIAPKNMLRCLHSSYTFADFWRAWHSSFNKWTVRYLYVPLGGRKTQTYSIWLIFTFIGLWHDLWWSWVAWALMNCFFFTIELLITQQFSQKRFNWVREIPGWSIFSCVLGGWNVAFLFCSNLTLVFGFAHMPTFLRICFLDPGSWIIYLSICTIYATACMLKREFRMREAVCPMSKMK